MDLAFRQDIASTYKSGSQKARRLTEDWAARSLFCPRCGVSGLRQFPNNAKVADLHCLACREEYELKSQSRAFGRVAEDGALGAMLSRIKAHNNPSFLFLHYDMGAWQVQNLFVVPRHFFTPAIIAARPPLKPSARRAGWIGCRILLETIPASGRIALVRNGVPEPVPDVLTAWRQTAFLDRVRQSEARTWLTAVMTRIERLGKSRFSLEDVYAFEDELSQVFPNNRHIREKLRQQLQVLRDQGYLRFTGRGNYHLARAEHDGLKPPRP